MPNYTPNQVKNLIEISLSRILALPKYEHGNGNHLFRIARLPPTTVTPTTFDHPAQLGHVQPSFSSLEQVGPNSFDVQLIPQMFKDGFVQQEFYDILGHEPIHMAQNLDSTIVEAAADIRFPNMMDRPSEQEAYALQRPVGEFVRTVNIIDESIINTDDPIVRTAKLLDAVKLIRKQKGQALSNISNIDIATQDPDELRQQSINLVSSINILENQISALEERLESFRNQQEQGES